MNKLLSCYSQVSKILNETDSKLSGSNSFEILNDLFTTRQFKNLPLRPNVWGRESNSVAICLVIVDELFHEQIWKAWIKEANEVQNNHRAQFYIHAKYPARIKSEWVRQHLIPEQHCPEWNSPEVIRAMLALLSTAVNDSVNPPCERYLFATESCIPVVSFSETCDILFREDVSWLSASNLPKNNWERVNCFLPVDPSVIPPKAVWKAVPGWILLTRRHAAEIVALNSQRFRPQLGDLVSAWGPPGAWSSSSGGVFAPEEVFFPTMLALLGYLDAEKIALSDQREQQQQQTDQHTTERQSGATAIKPREVRLQSLTYVEFARNGDANPKTYPKLTSQLLRQFRSSGALFARKFGRESVSLEEWSQLVLQPDESENFGRESECVADSQRRLNRDRDRRPEHHHQQHQQHSKYREDQLWSGDVGQPPSREVRRERSRSRDENRYSGTSHMRRGEERDRQRDRNSSYSTGRFHSSYNSGVPSSSSRNLQRGRSRSPTRR